MSTIICDSNSEDNYTADLSFSSGNSEKGGQLFTGCGGVLNSVVFYLDKLGTPTSKTFYCKIYEITGDYGTTGLPTGTPIATSIGYDVATMPANYALVTFEFTEANKVTLANGHYYAVVLEYSSANSYGFRIGVDSSGTHDGNLVYMIRGSGTWSYSSDQDACFYVYVDDVSVTGPFPTHFRVV